MPHDCLGFWGNPARRLTGLLRRQTDAQRRIARPGRGRPLRPYEGWVHRAACQADYDLLVKLHYEMCLATKQPTDIPTHWGRSEVMKRRRAGTVDAAAMGRLAARVLEGLAQDGAAVNATTGLPEHSLDGVPRYGTPNWLEKPEDPKAHGGRRSLPVARALLCELRAALAR